MKDLLAIFYERVPEYKATKHFWHARAYSDWHDFTHVMVIWPLHYAVQLGYWLSCAWDKYRHRKSWIDRQIAAAVEHSVKQSEEQDARRFIRRLLSKP